MRASLDCSRESAAKSAQITDGAPISMVMAPVVVMPVVMVPMVVMPVMVPVVMVIIPHFGGQRAGVILHRRGGNGTAQRQGLGAFGRGGNHEQCRDGGKAQNTLHVHVYPPWMQDVGSGAIIPSQRKTKTKLAAVQIGEASRRRVNAE